jgi:hypothetical protein
MSAVERVGCVGDRMSYIILRGRWCNIIVLIVHAPTGEKTDRVKASFYKELRRWLHKFPYYHMKILLAPFKGKLGWQTFLNRQFGMNVYNKVLYSHNATSISILGCPLMANPTISLNIL